MDKIIKEILQYIKDNYGDHSYEVNGNTHIIEFINFELNISFEPKGFYITSLIDYDNPNMMLIFSFESYNEFINKFTLNLNWEDYANETISQF